MSFVRSADFTRFRTFANIMMVYPISLGTTAFFMVKDPEFALKIILKRGVFDRRDVVAADVEEARHVKRQILDALVLERLARNLHDHGLATGRAAVGDMAPDLGGLGRGVGALVALDTIVGTHRADHAAGLARRLDDGLEHKSGRGLSLGAGDAQDRKSTRLNSSH